MWLQTECNHMCRAVFLHGCFQTSADLRISVKSKKYNINQSKYLSISFKTLLYNICKKICVFIQNLYSCVRFDESNNNKLR